MSENEQLGWFYTGDNANQRMQENIEEQEKNRAGGAPYSKRWWMKKTDGDEGKFLTFLDGPTHPDGYTMPVVFSEHQLFLDGSWRNWFTCIEGIPHPETGVPQMCPLCRMVNAKGENISKPSVVAAYSVIDHNEWVDRQGKTHKDELRLFVCKSAVHLTLKKALKRRGTLRGWKVEVSRATTDSPSTGDQFEWLDQTEIPEEIKPADYRGIFAPKTQEELEAIVAKKEKGGGQSENQSQKERSQAEVNIDDDTIPF